MEVAPGTRDPRQFGQHPVRMRNGMHHMAAHGKVEAMVRDAKLEYALVLESQPGRETGITRSRKLKVSIDDVHSQHMRARKEFGQPRRPLAGTAAGIKNAGLGWERIATNQFDFLRPNRPSLRIQAAHHGLVRHLLGLWVKVGHFVSSGSLYSVSSGSSVGLSK